MFTHKMFISVNKFGGIAQLEERALCKREAPGSKPGISRVYFGSISLEVRTPRCGRGNPGSNPGSSNEFFLLVASFETYSFSATLIGHKLYDITK